MTNQHRARAMAVALALCLVPLAQPAHADDDSTRSKNQKLIQSFTPYERAMYDKQQGKLGDAIAILEPMAAQGHGFEQAQLSLGECYIDSAAKLPPDQAHDMLVKGTKWILVASDAGLTMVIQAHM